MPLRSPQIVALGGGGFSMEPENPLLDRYILSLVAAEQPRICFLPTASSDAPQYIERFYTAFNATRSLPTHRALSEQEDDLEEHILQQDIIYVGGGNTKTMLALWKQHGLDRILREAWQAGVILAGVSAGAICWFEAGVTDSIPGALTPLICLGFLSGSACPHYDGEPERRDAYHHLLKTKQLSAGYAIEDGVALHFIEKKLQRIVSSRHKARAYQVELLQESVQETPLTTEYIGSFME